MRIDRPMESPRGGRKKIGFGRGISLPVGLIRTEANMKTKPTLLLLAAATILPSAIAQGTGSNIPKSLAENFRVEHYVEPGFPATFYNQGVKGGYAQIHLLVAADGTLLESFVSAYSHPEFAAAAEHAVGAWRFRPADNPASLPKRFTLRFEFERAGIILVQGNFHETVNDFLGHHDNYEVALCKLRDLDSTPEVINLVVPAYPPELLKQGVTGHAAVSFFIDETGSVHAVAVGEATRPEFAKVVLDAVRQWAFTPPLQKGHPTRVFAVQEFSFSPGNGVTENTTAN